MTTYGSVCSGIESATVGWHSLGWRAEWFAEIETTPSTILAHHYPHVPNLGDMTCIAALVRARLVSAPDVIVGGTPCQAFSVAGARRGLTDPRGQLTIAYADLADAVDEQRPGDECVIVWENVPGVLSDKGNAFGCFLALLAGEDEALTPEAQPAAGKSSKYWKWDKTNGEHSCRWSNAGAVYGPKRTIAWRVIDAQYFGVAQRRRRVFVVASARDGFDPGAVLFEFDGVRRDTAPSRETGQGVAGTIAPCLTSSGRGVERTGDTRGQDPVVACFGGNNQRGSIDVATARNACASASGRMDFESETFVVQSVVRRLTPRECERLQGFDDDYTLVPYRGKMVADGPRYKALGNSKAVPCIRWVGERIKKHLR